ncbi:MAG: DUF4010 domain-containing protein [Rubrivivax sp.]|nr:DUF4010 domain-containing protein [Rubrivivax sp.]
MGNLLSFDPATLGLVVALGCGLLIGVERERRKGQGPRREAAGLRTFAIVAACGGAAQWIDLPGLVVVGAVLVAALATVAYLRSTRDGPAPDADPGLTTEIALFATYLVGVVAVRAPALGAACGVALAALLAARDRLHRFATHWLSESELHDGLLLAALALIALPLVPAGPLPVLGGIQLRPLAFLVVLILVLQAVAHVSLRLLGARGGLLLVGFLSGFVSSTATVATMGRRARSEPEHAQACAAGAGMSGAATWVLAVVVVGAIAPALVPIIAAAAAVAAAVAAAASWWLARRATSPAPVHEAAASASQAPSRGPLRLREALVLAALLLGISAAVAMLTGWVGPSAALPGAALAALADAHAAVAALASLVRSGTLAPPMLGWGLLVAVGTNTASRLVVATATGGGAFARRVAVPLVASLVAAASAVVGSAWLPAFA